MKNISTLKVNPLIGYDDSTLSWKRLTDPKKTFDYPVDYWVAILGFDVEKKHVDFMGKWEPNSYCHYHRHLSPTTSIVLAGEHNLMDFAELSDVETLKQLFDAFSKKQMLIDLLD